MSRYPAGVPLHEEIKDALTYYVDTLAHTEFAKPKHPLRTAVPSLASLILTPNVSKDMLANQRLHAATVTIPVILCYLFSHHLSDGTDLDVISRNILDYIENDQDVSFADQDFDLATMVGNEHLLLLLSMACVDKFCLRAFSYVLRGHDLTWVQALLAVKSLRVGYDVIYTSV